jgi:hypothetical protein
VSRKTSPKADIDIQVDGTEQIVVRMHAPDRGVWRESFQGKWVDKSIGGWCDENQSALVWRVGITASGRSVAYRGLTDHEESRRRQGVSEANTESLLLVFDTAEEFAAGVVNAGFPDSCVKWALSKLE